MELNKLIIQAHKIAVEHGWWENPQSLPVQLALINSETAEALEEYRKGFKPTETYYSGEKQDMISQPDQRDDFANDVYNLKKHVVFTSNVPLGQYRGVNLIKPEGIPSELADIVIRVFDMCGYYGIDLETAIKEKMKYNELRPHKHGGKSI